MAGGFVGVDVFFVISGYLITSIILSEKAAGSFSFVRFYERRARRIMPVLLLVMAVCIPFAYAFMLPDDLENFGQSLVSTGLFANNVLLAKTSGYFDLAAEFKPLLHTWSLGIEEQYYLLFPALVICLWPIGKKAMVILLMGLAVASLAQSQLLLQHANTLPPYERGPATVPVYYYLTYRAWELLVGALLAYFLVGRTSQPERASLAAQLASAAGIAMIAFAVLAFDKATPFPGIYALVPVMGAALIILCARPGTVVGRVLGSKWLVGVGLVSYSLYLWHQPLFAFARLLSLQEPEPGVYLALIGLAGLLAYLSWRFVELPIRRNGVSRGTIFAGSAAASAVLVAIGAMFHIKSGFASDWVELNAGAQEGGRRLNAIYNERPFALKAKTFTTGKRHILVVGNSFARDFVNAAIENNYFTDSELIYSDLLPNCMSSLDGVNPELRAALSKADVLILASGGVYVPCWPKMHELLQSSGAKKILVIGTKNFGWNMNGVMRKSTAERQAYRAKVVDAIWTDNELQKRVLDASYFIDLLGMLADGERRVPLFTDTGKLISQDTKHLTKEGARFIGQIAFQHPLLADLK